MRKQYLLGLLERWRPVAEVYAALGDPTRQHILLLFSPGEELSIKDIAEQFNYGRSTIVHHLGVLEKASVLAVRRQGRLALYKIRYDVVLDALDNLRQLIREDLAELGGAGIEGRAYEDGAVYEQHSVE